MSLLSTPARRVLWSSLAVLAVAAGVQLSARAQAPAAASTSPEMAALHRLTFRNVGPTNQAGRVSVIVGVPGDPYTFYVAGANGGIFKTTNGGTTWEPLFDHQAVLSIGAIEIAPSNPNVIYVGTGEENPRNNASFGNGVYRSDDGGMTWRHLGLPDSDRIARIRIDRRDPDVAYVCAMGHEWGPNDERGVYKTTDGGRNWKRVLFLDQQTACSDIDVDPDNSNVIYAGMWTFRRYAWLLESGGRQTALYKSVDGGATWKKLTNGIPAMLDRIGVAVARSEPDVVYMVSETPNYEGELWRSEDAGASWRVVNKDPNINFRPFYYADIRVDPNDPNRVYSLSGSLYLSEDAGRTFRRIGNDVHGDHQALWIDPTNSKRVLSGSDGGFQVSYDGGKNFNVLNNLAFTQFYHINYDLQNPYMVCGGLQDNGTWCGPSNSLLSEGIRKNDWFTVGGGDGFFAVPDLKEPWRVYTDLQGGVINVMDTRSGAAKAISPYPNRIGSVGDAMEHHKFRYNWNSPIVLSPQDGQTVYFGGNVLFKTTNHGQSWTQISPDLTTNDKNKQKSSGGPIVTDNTAAEFHCTIITIAPSPVDANVIWVGTDDGNVQVTRDGGKTWTNTIANAPGLAPNAWIPTVEASHFDAGTAYIAADHHQDDDYTAYFFKTTDYGKTWTRLTVGEPKVTGWPHVIREDPKVRSLLYAGTELGLWVSFDGGAKWASLRQNMPPVPVRDIQIQPREDDLLVATHGRGLYIMDDIRPLQHIAEALRTDAELFDIRPATRWNIWGKDGNLGQAVWKAPNPPEGVIIDYYLKADQKDDVVVTIADKAGKTIRTLRRAPKTAGVNRVTWDLRYDGPRQVGGGREGADEESRYRFAGGPYVTPGEYTVKVHAAGRDLTKTVTVAMDPRVPVTAADLQAQLDAALTLRDMMSKVNMTIDRANSLIEQLKALSERLKKQPMQADLAKQVDDALAAVTKLRDEELTRPYPSMGYRQYPRVSEEIRSLSGSVSRAQAKPTDPETGRIKELATELDKDIAALDQIVGGPISAINESMRSAPFISVPK
jgi:photosystem II stability/assembly factor-like uncharacterized protein